MRTTNPEDLNDNDGTSTHGHSHSFMVELRIDVFLDVKAMKEHKVDIEVSTIIGTEAKIVKQVSTWRPAGITWVRLENTAATTKTMRNTSDELSWDRAKVRSLAGGIAIYLVLDWRNIASDIEELIERIGHERVAENLNNAVMNSTRLSIFSTSASRITSTLWTLFHSDINVKSIYLYDTRNGQHQVVKEGQSGWILQAVISFVPEDTAKCQVLFYHEVAPHQQHICRNTRNREEFAACSTYCNAPATGRLGCWRLHKCRMASLVGQRSSVHQVAITKFGSTSSTSMRDWSSAYPRKTNIVDQSRGRGTRRTTTARKEGRIVST